MSHDSRKTILRIVLVMTLSSVLLVAGCHKRPQRKIECIDGSARLQKVLDRHTRLDSTARAARWIAREGVGASEMTWPILAAAFVSGGITSPRFL